MVEVKPTASVYGVGINQPANSLRALRTIGVLDDCLDAGFRFDRMSFHDWHDELIVEVPSGLGGSDVPANNALTRADLQKALMGATDRSGIKIAYGTTATSIHDDGYGVDVQLSDGRSGRYDLVIGFDGIKSGIRPLVGDRGDAAVFSGYSVWRLTVPRPSDVVFPRLYLGVGSKAGVIPLNDREMYLLLVTPEPGNPRLDETRFDDLLVERLAPYTGLIGDLRDSVSSPAGIVYSPLIEVFLPSPWHRGRIIALGDAAHACAPHLTQGAAMALEDAVVLAEELGADRSVDQALGAFMARRWERCRFVHEASHAILAAEMSVTIQTLAPTIAGMREHLPEQMAAVDAVLEQAA